MSLIGFGYLKKQRILTLALVLIVASMLFSLTAFSLLGFYRGFTAYLGEGQAFVAIYNRKSSTPYTGRIPAYLAEKISELDGVLASSPEMLIPCTVKGEALFLRGILPKEFTKLNPLKILEGDMLELTDVNSMIIGKNAAEKLGLKPDDKALVLSVIMDRYAELQVKGIFSSGSAMDDEVIAPLYVGQWLRKTDYGHVTLIRVKIDKSLITPAAISDMVAKETSEPTPPSQGETPTPSEGQIIPRVIVRFNMEDIGVEEAERFMKSYIDRYGLTREALLILSATTFLFSSISIAVAAKTVITQHKGEINVLRSVGASKKLLKRDLLIKLLPWSIIASIIGVALAAAALTIIQENGYLQVLSHTLPFQLDPPVIALNFILVSLLLTVSILRSEVEI